MDYAGYGSHLVNNLVCICPDDCTVNTVSPAKRQEAACHGGPVKREREKALGILFLNTPYNTPHKYCFNLEEQI